MTAIFVSYSSKDRHVVQRLVLELQNAGHAVWWDRAIVPGTRFDQTISAELDRAEVVVTVWSHSSVQSDWVRWEAGEALNRGCLVPVRIDDAHLPAEFQRIQLLDLRPFAAFQADPDDELGRLIRSIPLLVEKAVEPVTESDSIPAAQSPGAASDLQALAIMPFRNHSKDEEYDYFADGISEDLVHALSIWKSFPVISYASTLQFKDQAYSLQTVAEKLSVRYLVTEQVRRASERIRVSAELTDAITNRQIWRERWTGELSDFFELQEEISTWIATHIMPVLVAEARDQAVRKRPADMNAWDLSLRALSE